MFEWKLDRSADVLPQLDMSTELLLEEENLFDDLSELFSEFDIHSFGIKCNDRFIELDLWVDFGLFLQEFYNYVEGLSVQKKVIEIELFEQGTDIEILFEKESNGSFNIKLNVDNEEYQTHATHIDLMVNARVVFEEVIRTISESNCLLLEKAYYKNYVTSIQRQFKLYSE